jgi:serine/threonine protein kinase/GH43 family beta-xylosidase
VADGPKSSDSLVPGQQAGPWVIEAELGRGGMGVVYAVRHVQIGKRAALKVMHRRLNQPHLSAERMVLEAQVVNAIGHPNIVDIFDVGTTVDGRPYIVMEQLRGCSLWDVSPTVDEALEILLQTSDALIAAHAAGVVHRDLKPENIFLADDPGHFLRVKLLDWGIARILHVETRYTVEGQLVGTPRYVSPEQARGSPVTAPSDVYSFGVVAYELLLGQPPFDAATASEVMAMHMLASPRPPRSLWPSITSDLEALLLAMLNKEPSARPTMVEVAARLRRGRDELRKTRELQRRPPAILVDDLFDDEPPAVQRSRRWRYALAVLPFAAAIALFVVTQRSAQVPAEPPAPSAASSQARPAPMQRRSSPSRPLPNPLLEDCADPSIVHADASYYLACTGTRGGNTYPLYRSADLASWQRVGWIFSAGQRPMWAMGNYWAPEIHRAATGYAAYFSMRARGGQNAIGVATAPSVEGPYVAAPSPLTAPAGGASDAHVLVVDNERYLYYKRDKQPSSIWAQRLTGNGVAVEGEPVLVLAATQPWEHGNVEAPLVIRDGDFFYLFYSAARYCERDYAIGVARARSPLGPFEKVTMPILRSGTEWLAPGHTTAVNRDGERFLAYHAYRRSEGEPSCSRSGRNSRRHTRIDRLVFTNGWPQVLAKL